jgi:hypothetical protein
VAVDGVSHDAHECDAKRLVILILSKCRVFFFFNNLKCPGQFTRTTINLQTH